MRGRDLQLLIVRLNVPSGHTLGNANFTSSGKRHPTVGNNVIIGAGAKLLGPIIAGDYSTVGAGTIVNKNEGHLLSIWRKLRLSGLKS